MSISRYYFSFAQGLFYVLGNLFAARTVGIQFSLHFKYPFDHFLVGQAMQWTCQSIHTCCKSKVRISECRTYQVSGMCRYISSFMICMDGHIKTHELFKLLIFIAEHMCEVA